MHESDEQYDSLVSSEERYVPDAGGHVRIEFGSTDPDICYNIKLAELPGLVDAAMADINREGRADIMVALELAYLLYLQNPGRRLRTCPWPRLSLPNTRDRRSYIRVFSADLDEDSQAEVILLLTREPSVQVLGTA